jgi:hypothetical protein
MAGSAALVTTEDIQGQPDFLPGPLSGTAQNVDLFNLYVANDSSQVLFTQYTP